MNDPSPGRCVLVVDDDPDIAQMLRTRLVHEGFEVMLASSGTEAVERMADRVPDALVIDINLPGLSGHQVAFTMREMHPAVPIVMITASHDPGAQKTGQFYASINAFLRKPFDPGEVAQRLRDLLGP
ncbi:MAG: response regulator transcription factor [Planctomycetes bacterium]|nr:response regulator transcription factor [Planctomycetota bacterium]